ncbi:hypothetical protein ACS0TY_024395 [Phlomoides rotata]
MRESKDLSKISTFELFSNLKTYEFDIDRRKDEETSSSKVIALVATDSNVVVESEDEQDEMVLFIRKSGHFIKDCSYPETKKYSEEKKSTKAKKKRKQDKERIKALLLELEKSKEASTAPILPVQLQSLKMRTQVIQKIMKLLFV